MSVDDEADHLRGIAAFARLDRSKLKLLAFASGLLDFEAGDILFHEGEPGDSVFVLMDGTAQVLIERADEEIILADIGPDDVVGEIAALCDVPRTATVRAATPLRALVIPKDVFFRLVTESPSVGLEFMRLMAARFSRTVEHLIADRFRHGSRRAADPL